MYFLYCRNCGCLHTLADIDHPNVRRARVETRQENRVCQGILTGVNETWFCPECGTLHVNSYTKPPKTPYSHEDIEREAYYRYLLRQRKGIEGDHLADWYFAIEKLNGGQLFELRSLDLQPKSSVV